ncbi:MAG: Celeribacter phage [Bacteroidota bacterium]
MDFITYTVNVYANGRKEWYKDGKLHRSDGPAVEWTNGDKKWYINDKLHRSDGPAVEWINGDKAWYINGKLHRTDGPAIEYSDGHKEWYKDGNQLSEEKFNKTKNTFDGKVVEIDGKKYKLNAM